ncbi:TetR/AcrR family transcriptional regulator [Sporosarcina sp. Te-1]|uniref:TetR/AcrR family transcriptional regulator n=1 Tax=Sporosarcina sp. Te-1 TaxID=2818390 RepID=UPI001A9FCB50|nr:TetR/AcrR family transcriptional regulator [Sporosarcina sp. Te-1]QTD40040.1 TetR/AcrR family transcriptional regulator [Sporosarcina sp. Te-1]
MAKPNVSNKDSLIQAAKTCIARDGLENFTLKTVADEGGVSQGTVYYHFRTKEQLLLEVVKELCESSWEGLVAQEELIIKEALASAKSRCAFDSFYHRLYFTLLSSSLHNQRIREQLKEILRKENEVLSLQVESIWTVSPVNGVSTQTWGIVLNSIIDGIAMQALLDEEFPVDQVYAELELIIEGLTQFAKGEQAT